MVYGEVSVTIAHHLLSEDRHLSMGKENKIIKTRLSLGPNKNMLNKKSLNMTVVSDLSSETNGSRFESDLCAEASSLQ